MTILTIECSCSIGSIALIRDGKALHTTIFENPRGRGTAFFAALEDACHHTDALDLVLVGTGPGSYNSLRVSLAAAWGVAKARSAQLRGICSLLGYEPSEYHVLGDARANQWFHAHIQDDCLIAPPTLLTPEEAGLRIVSDAPVFTTSPLPIEHAICAPPEAIHLARRFSQADCAEPIYLKPPHITQPSR